MTELKRPLVGLTSDPVDRSIQELYLYWLIVHATEGTLVCVIANKYPNPPLGSLMDKVFSLEKDTKTLGDITTVESKLIGMSGDQNLNSGDVLSWIVFYGSYPHGFRVQPGSSDIISLEDSDGSTT